MGSRSKKKGKQNVSLYSRTLKVFQRAPNKQFSYKLLNKKLGKKVAYDEVKAVVEELITRGQVERVDKRLRLIARDQVRSQTKRSFSTDTITGKLDMSLKGFGYLVSEQSVDDIYISSKRLGHALDGDTIEIKLRRSNRRDGRMEGEVVNVIERACEDFIGTLKLSKEFAFVIPDKKNMPVDIFVPINKLNGAKDNEKVVVKMEDWPEKAKSPIGRVLESLKGLSSNDLAMNTILVDQGFKLRFPAPVLKASEDIEEKITKEEIANRRDFRKVTTFTIDPKDAKDFDDALSIKRLGEDTYEVGVHIADVTHYVRAGSALDKEASERGNSVYLVDRVVPMFPERLSNIICSLRPNEDKLCYAAVFEVNTNGKILNQWFGRTVIHSDKRFVYEEAQKVLDDGQGLYYEELDILNKIAYKLREKRFENGSVAFETSEVQFELDEDNVPINVIKKERGDTHLLVEDFMLLANKKVAEVVSKASLQKPMVYRVHDEPDPEKIIDLAQMALTFHHKMDVSTPNKVPFAINQLMQDIKGKPEQDLLEKLAIRSMAKAVYTTDNIGHYGLGFPFYVHFTSPIRRYADVMVHRLLTYFLSKSKQAVDVNQIEKSCVHISDMERRAMEAERASVKYKQVEYMQQHVGEVFEGVISGVTDWGIFVELDGNKCEGMVRISDLEGERYTYNKKDSSVTGNLSGTKYQLGGRLKIKVKKADIVNSNLDFEIAEE